MKAFITVGLWAGADGAGESGKDGKRMRMAVNGKAKGGEKRQDEEERMLVVENITTFGSREQVSPTFYYCMNSYVPSSSSISF